MPPSEKFLFQIDWEGELWIDGFSISHNTAIFVTDFCLSSIIDFLFNNFSVR